MVKILDAHYWEPARVAKHPDDPLFNEEQRWLYDEMWEGRAGMSEGTWSARYAADVDEASAGAGPSSSLAPAQLPEQAYGDMPALEAPQASRARPRRISVATFMKNNVVVGLLRRVHAQSSLKLWASKPQRASRPLRS